MPADDLRAEALALCEAVERLSLAYKLHEIPDERLDVWADVNGPLAALRARKADGTVGRTFPYDSSALAAIIADLLDGYYGYLPAKPSAPAPAPSELLPCPFCGLPGDLTENEGLWMAGCSAGQRADDPDTLCRSNVITFAHRTPEGAIAAWNRRAAPSVTDEEVAREVANTRIGVPTGIEWDEQIMSEARAVVRAVAAARERCEARARKEGT